MLLIFKEIYNCLTAGLINLPILKDILSSISNKKKEGLIMPIKNCFKLVYGESTKKDGWTWYALDVYQEDKRVFRIFLKDINQYLIIKNILNSEVE